MTDMAQASMMPHYHLSIPDRIVLGLGTATRWGVYVANGLVVGMIVIAVVATWTV